MAHVSAVKPSRQAALQSKQVSSSESFASWCCTQPQGMTLFCYQVFAWAEHCEHTCCAKRLTLHGLGQEAKASMEHGHWQLATLDYGPYLCSELAQVRVCEQ